MKKITQRVIALWLALFVVASGLPVTAYATEYGPSVSANEIVDEVSTSQVQSVSANSDENPDMENISAEDTKPEEENVSTFYYEEYFEQSGVKVSLSAEEGVVPEGAYADIEPLNASVMKGIASVLQEGVDASLAEKKALAEADPALSVYDMYYDLHANVEDTYAYDFTIWYEDANGNTQVFEPGEGQVVNVSFSIPGIAEVVADEMQEIDLHHVVEDNDVSPSRGPNQITAEGSSQGGASCQYETEILSEKLTSSEDVISFEAEHFSVYAVTVATLAATADPAMVTAQKRAWKLIQNYADPAYGLTDPYRKDLTDAQYAELQSVAKSVISGCDTQYEKIEALTRYVADTVYWDQPYLNDHVNNPYIGNPYDVYKLKKAVCGGYSRLFHTLLTSVGIPCLDIHNVAYTHVFNAVYDSDTGRWIYIDVSWCSSNQYYGPNNREYKGYNGRHFDLAPEEIATASSHEVYDLHGFLYSNGYYQLKDAGSNWSDMNWSMNVIGAPAGVKTLRAVGAIDNIPVTGVNENGRAYEYRFYENKVIEHIDLSATKISIIEEWAFAKNPVLKTVVLPSSLTSMGECVFYHCNSLQSIDLSKTKVSVIDKWTFADCSSLTDIKLPQTATLIKELSFYNCDALQKVDMSSTKVETIEKRAFYSCDNLKTLKFSKVLKEAGEEAFGFCKKLAKVDLSSTKIKKINDRVFYVCSSLKKVILPRTLKTIGKESFAFCLKLKSISIPKSVKKIDNKAFNAYNLTIYGAKKSRAQKYAKKMKYTFKEKAPAKKIKFTKKKVKMKKGEKITLDVKLVPADSIDTIKWSSSNKKVAKVNSQGVVTAKKKGTATITAKTKAGKKVTCKITVK